MNDKDQKKKVVFISGLPRSGSTLLCNLLAQNPRFRSDGVTSGLLDVLLTIKHRWNQAPEMNNWPQPEALKRVLRAAFYAYFSDTQHAVAFDKCRGWPAQIEMAETLMESKAKVICIVRDMRAIMASWERLWRKTKDTTETNIPSPAVFSIQERVKHWSSQTQPTGTAYLVLQDAIHRGLSDRMIFVEYDRLVLNTSEELRRIYSFIEEAYFEHNPDQVEQKKLEKDPAPWMRDLHKIRPKIDAGPKDWNEILGPAIERLEEANFLWSNRV